MTPRSASRAPDPDEFADAIVATNQVLAQMSARYLDSLSPGINSSEFRALVILSQHGPQRLIDIAGALDVTSTTATRLADRLAGHGLVDRVRQSRDRREVHLAIAEPGRALVAAVHSHRRLHMASALSQFTERDQLAAFDLLARLAGHEDGHAEEIA